MSEEVPIFILDSFALLAFLEGEVGAQRVQRILERATNEETLAYLSLINLGEILYITEREQGLAQAQKVLAAIDALPITLLPATRERILAAAHLKANHRLAYADAFAAAAAQEFEGTLVTGDPEFESVAQLIRIEWLPKKAT